MPPGDPPLQDTAITFRQDCEQRFAKAGLLGVAKGEWPARAEAVEQNFPLHLLPPLTATATAKEVQDRIAIQWIQIRNDRNDRLRLMYLMEADARPSRAPACSASSRRRREGMLASDGR